MPTFLPGRNLDNGNPEILLAVDLYATTSSLPGKSNKRFLENVAEKAS